MIKLYSTGCPQCMVLKQKLDTAKIEYEVETSFEVMESLGFMSVPVLDVDGEIKTFADAVRWVNSEVTKN